MTVGALQVFLPCGILDPEILRHLATRATVHECGRRAKQHSTEEVVCCTAFPLRSTAMHIGRNEITKETSEEGKPFIALVIRVGLIQEIAGVNPILSG